MIMIVSGKKIREVMLHIFIMRNIFSNGHDINIISDLVKFAENAKPESSKGINPLAQVQFEMTWKINFSFFWSLNWNSISHTVLVMIAFICDALSCLWCSAASRSGEERQAQVFVSFWSKAPGWKEPDGEKSIFKLVQSKHHGMGGVTYFTYFAKV